MFPPPHGKNSIMGVHPQRLRKKKNGEKEMWRKIGNVVYGLLLVLLILTLSGYLLLTGV